MSQWPQITLFQPNNSSIILLLIFREKENSKIVLALEMPEIKTDVYILIANISDEEGDNGEELNQDTSSTFSTLVS